MQSSQKYALIGTGKWGKNILKTLYNLNYLHTICDINQTTLDEFKTLYPNIHTTTDFKLILTNPDIHGVFIALPAEMHYSFAQQVLEYNKDLYIEKPITLNVNEAENLVRMAEERKRILMVGHILHYHPAIEKIKEIINNNEIGEIVSITSNRLNLGTFRTEENVLWSFGCHDISIILSLCNYKTPTNIHVSGKSHITESIHDIINITMNIEQIYININLSWIHPYKEQKLIVIGTKGMLVFDDLEVNDKLKVYYNYIKRDNLNIPIANKTEPIIINCMSNMTPLEKECLHFVKCCENRSKPSTSGEEGIEVLKVLEICSKIIQPKYFSHSSSFIDKGATIGNETKIWHCSHITDTAEIGERCNIGQNCYIAGKIGDGCKVQNNVSIYLGVQAENNVFFGPSCVLTNDKNPRCEYSKNGNYIQTYIETGVTIGANATIICGIKIGKYALIGAGAVITKNVEPYSIMVGNPAIKIGCIDEKGNRFYN